MSSHCYHCTFYGVNKQIHEDLRVRFFTDHIRSLTERFDSKLAYVGNPLVTQLGRYLRWPSVDPGPIRQGDRNRQLVLATCKTRSCRHIELCPTGPFRLPWLRFFFRAFFLSLRQMSGYNTQRRGTGRSLPRHGGNTWVSKFHRDLTIWVRMQESLAAKVIPPDTAYFLLNNGSHLTHVEVFNRDGKSLAYAQSQL